MARLPDVVSLGTRPIPQSGARFTSTPGVGAIGEAVSGLGEQLYRTGQQQFEKQDKLAFAAAKTAIIKADVATRTELSNDPDWTTYEARYTEKMTAARDAARSLIPNKSDRALFDADADLDFERGRADILKTVNAKRASTKSATLYTSLDALQDAAAGALDEPTRAAAIKTAGDLFDAGVAEGFLTPEQAGEGRRKWASNYVAETVSSALLREDVDGAAKAFEANKDKLDWNTRVSLEGDIKRSLDKRVAYTDAAGIKGDGSPVGADPTNYADPLRGLATRVSAEFGERRGGGKTHNGVDFAAPAGTPIHSLAAGTVTKVGHDAQSGNFIIVDHHDGTTSSYSHMGSASALGEGDEVSPDTLLGKVGSTGHSTGPHLHLVVRKNGQTVDPESVIGKARQGPVREDINALLAKADARADREGWSFERRERAKDELRKQTSLNDSLLARQEADADDAADAVLVSKREGFTDTSQIPRAVWNNLSPSAKVKYQNIAEANSKPKAVAANGPVSTGLELMRIGSPEAFMQLNLGQFANQMTPGEFAGILKDQATLKAKPPEQNDVRAKVSATISTYSTPDLWGDDKDEGAARRVRAQRIMEADIEAVTKGKRPPTEDELYKAFLSATGTALRFDKTFMGIKTGGQREVRRFDIQVSDIPEEVANRIRASLQQQLGIRAPTDEQIAEEYARGKGRFW